MTNTQSKTARLAKMAMLVAISIVLVAIVRFPIFPAVAFLEYDPADIPIMVGTFAFGPGAGILLTVVTSVLQGVTVSAKSGAYGIIMHIIATSTLVIAAGLIYRKEKTKKHAIMGLLCGTASYYDSCKSCDHASFYGRAALSGLGSDAFYCSL